MHYQIDLRRKTSKKKSVMIIHESDERQFRDLEEFHKATQSERVYTICLTATAYDGSVDGLERWVLDELGYKIYTSSDKGEEFDPVIHNKEEIGSLDNYRSRI